VTGRVESLDPVDPLAVAAGVPEEPVVPDVPEPLEPEPLEPEPVDPELPLEDDELDAPVTTTVPCIHGWTEQM
jgi:hypothetical protein